MMGSANNLGPVMAPSVPPSEAEKKPVAGVDVLKLAGCWLAIKTEGEVTSFISKHPEMELKVALVAAIEFAVKNKLPCSLQPKEMDRAVVTLFEADSKWTLVELFPDEIKMVEEVSFLDSKNEMLARGKQYSAAKKLHYLPHLRFKEAE